MKSLSSFFQFDSPFGQILSRVLDLFVLSLLWACLCLTIIGIGPATVAMCYTIRHCIRSEGQPLLHTFFHALRDGAYQTIPAGLLMFLFSIATCCTDVPALLLVCVDFLENFNFFTIFSLLKILLLLWVWLYLFPILAQYHIGLIGAFFQSITLAFSHIIPTVLMSLIAVASVFSVLHYPLLIAIAPGICAYAFSYLAQSPLATLSPIEHKVH